MTAQLHGTVALVTGASSGIGETTALAPAAEVRPSPSWRGDAIDSSTSGRASNPQAAPRLS